MKYFGLYPAPDITHVGGRTASCGLTERSLSEGTGPNGSFGPFERSNQCNNLHLASAAFCISWIALGNSYGGKFDMRMKLPFLAGAIAIATAGNAMAWPDKISIISVTGSIPSNVKDAPTRLLMNTAITAKVVKPRKSESFGSLPISIFDELSSGVSAKNPLDEYTRISTANLQMARNNRENLGQTFAGSSNDRDRNILDGSFRGEIDIRTGGNPNRNIEDIFFEHFGNDFDIPRQDDQMHYFNCSVSAVPEPDERFIMLCCLSLFGLFAIFGKRRAFISIWPILIRRRQSNIEQAILNSQIILFL